MAATPATDYHEPRPAAHRIGNVYYPRFGFGTGRAGAVGLDSMLDDIRDAVDEIGRDTRAISEENRNLARLCNEGARKVTHVIDVIDGVAFETNLLALNTAIEASRCGDGGAEITLVASEIRELVRKSAAATREMRALLGDSVRRAEGGFRLVDEVGTTMEDIVGAVRQVTEILTEICREQNRSDEEVPLVPVPA